MTGPRVSRAAQMVKGLASLLMLAVLTGGPPAALYKMSGSPIPHTLPSWHQVLATLMRRDDGTLFLATVRYVTWLAWVAFTISVVVEAVSRARGRPAPHLPVIGPAQTFAAALIGAAVLSLLPAPQLRAAPPITRAYQAVAAAPPRPGQPSPPPSALGAQQQALPPWALPATATAAGLAGGQGTSMQQAHRHAHTHTVVEGDDLWDIAARFLGDGERWHEIYALNAGKLQPGGGSLTDPDLIYPGWVLLLPAGSTGPIRHSVAPHGPARRPQRPTSPATPGHAHATPPAERPSAEPLPGHHAGGHSPARPLHHGPTARPRTRPVAIHLPSGGLVGVTFAAAISAALVAWRLHRRRVATARWPIPDEPFEPPLPDTIRTLRRAHLDSLAADTAEAHGEPWPGDETALLTSSSHSAEDDGEEGIDEFGAPTGSAEWRPSVAAADQLAGETRRDPRPAAAGQAEHPLRGEPPGPPAVWLPAPPPARPLPGNAVTFGVRGDAEILLASVARHGLGLTGPGARGTARALLIALLTAGTARPRRREDEYRVVIPRAEAQELIPEDAITRTGGAGPPNLVITDTLDEALDRVEAETTGGRHGMRAALMARPESAAVQRIEAVLGVGAQADVIGVLLGDWDTGVTCRVNADGVVTAASGADLTGVQTYHLPDTDAASLLTLLRGAHGDVADDRPGTPIPSLPPSRAATQAATGDGPNTGVSCDHDPGARPPHAGTGSTHQTGPKFAPEPGGPSDLMAGRSADKHSQRSAARSNPYAGGPSGDSASGRATTPGTVLAAPVAPASPSPGRPRLVRIRLLGIPQIEAAGREIRTGLRQSSWELLAFLALFPDGAAGEKVVAAIWPDDPASRTRIALQTALRSLRVALRTATARPGPMFITYAAGRYRIDRNLIDVDLWRFHETLAAADQALRTGDHIAAREALADAVSHYQGPLAADAAYDWIEPYREEIRRQAVDAHTRLAGMHEPAESEQALGLLDQALTHDPFNEQLYQRIMAIQARLGRLDAIQRTLRLLETRLAEISTTPGEDTYATAASLQRPRLASAPPVESADQ
jgi:DNA-binding SARP family transcriptional activator